MEPEANRLKQVGFDADASGTPEDTVEYGYARNPQHGQRWTENPLQVAVSATRA